MWDAGGMAMKPCKECGQAVSTSANACPKCGKKSPTGMSPIMMFGGGFIFVVIAIIWIKNRVAEFSGSEIQTSSPIVSDSRSIQHEAPPPIKITARALREAYEENEVAADAEYKGKALNMSGTLSSIDKDAFGNVVMWVSTGSEFERAMAKLKDGQEPAAARLRKGRRVSLLCIGDGRTLGSAILTDCLIQ